MDGFQTSPCARLMTCRLSIIQQQAEAILDRLGIPVSVFIDMTYRQVIMRDGVPFSLDIPDKLVTRDL